MAKRRKTKPAAHTRDDDMELWSQVTSSVTPLRRRLGDAPRTTAAGECGPEAQRGSTRKRAASTPSSKTSSVQRPEALRKMDVEKPTVPPLTGLDRRTSQKLTRGNTQIEGRIDLHGMGRESARTALKSFIIRSRAAGKRTVLAITGKGHSPYSSHTLHGYEHVNTPERQGVIRKAFPQWLNEPEFRVHVAGYQPAHPRHGGGGAFYIRLRRQKD